MSGDMLITLLQRVRAELPDVPEHKWAEIEAALRGEVGGGSAYIARRSKATHLARLEAAAAADASMSNQQLADLLGVSVRHARRLKRLNGGG